MFDNKKIILITASLLFFHNCLKNNKRKVLENNKTYFEIRNIDYDFFDIDVKSTNEIKYVLNNINPNTKIKYLNYDGTLNKIFKILFISTFNSLIYVQLSEDHHFNKFIPHIFSIEDKTIKPLYSEPNIKIINF